MFWVGKLKWDILSVILASLKKGRMMIEKSSHTGNILKDTSFLISRSFWTSKLSGSKKSSSEQYPRGNTLLKIKSHSPLPFNQTLNVFIWVIYHLDSVWNRGKWKTQYYRCVDFIFQGFKRQWGWGDWKGRNRLWWWPTTGRLNNVSPWTHVNA